MDRKSRFFAKYIQNLPGTARAMAMVFNEIQYQQSKSRVLDVQAQMRPFGYFYGLRLGIRLLRHSDSISALLQTKDLCAAEAQTVEKHIKKMSKDENRHLFWEDAKQKATKLDVDALKLSRKRRTPTRIEELFSENGAPEYANDVVYHHPRICFESLD